jgi:CBS domain-containing protein
MIVTAEAEEQTTPGTVSQAMTREVVLLVADMSAEMALRRLDHRAVSGAPVVDHGRVVGVVTRRDLLVPTLLDDPTGALALAPAQRHSSRLASLKVGELMSAEPVTARPDWPLGLAVRTMVAHGVNRLPVVDRASRPLGILTRDDVLRTLAEGEQDGPSH